MKKHGKRVVAILLMSVMMILSITACSRSKDNNDVSSSDTSTSKPSTNTTTTKPPTTIVTLTDDAEDESEEPTEEKEEEQAPEVVAPEEEAPEEEAHGGHTASKNNSSAISAFAKLLSGNTQYLSGSINPSVDANLRKDLVENGQHPYAIVITCSDSRVPAELIFNAGLGEIFVIRTAGNVVSDFEIGSIEYGAEHLGSPLVFVLGHTNCGAVTAATEGGEAGGSIQSIVNEIAPSVAKARENGSEENLLPRAIEFNVSNSINKIRQSPIMQELEEEGKVAIIGGVYDIQSGSIKVLE